MAPKLRWLQFVLGCFLACCLSMGLLGCQWNAIALSPPLTQKNSSVKYQPLPPVINADSTIIFADEAARDGLHYRWVIPGKRPLTILQTIGNGCAFLDYNNDGNLDILLVGSRLALYRGDGHGHFTDVTHEMGLDQMQGHFLGCCIGDYDDDGYDDLYISGYQTGILLHNEHGHRFRDVTKEAGLPPQPWGTSCTFADFDGDGFLDLFVGDYLQFDDTSQKFCSQGSVLAACGPLFYHHIHGALYHNLAGRRFEDVTALWKARTTGDNLGVAAADFDSSGHIGLAVANDELAGDLLRNQDGKHLTNINDRSGTGADRFGHSHGGMGIDWGDYDNDGKLDLIVTTFIHEDKCLYHNLGRGVFEERGAETGLASALEPDVSFGCKFADFDNDGWLDLLVASGHIADNAAKIKAHESYRQPIELLRNGGSQPVGFARVTRSAGLEKLSPIVGRGLAVGDFDNDGRMDALVVDSEGAPLLLHNTSGRVSHWIGFRLVGSGRSNRDAYEATVTVTAKGHTYLRLCHADGSYLSSSDKRVHIGLDQARQVDSVTVHWPDGKEEVWRHPAIDQYHIWTESQSPVGERSP